MRDAGPPIVSPVVPSPGFRHHRDAAFRGKRPGKPDGHAARRFYPDGTGEKGQPLGAGNRLIAGPPDR